MKLAMILAYFAAMFLIFMFLRWYIPTFGDMGFVFWIIGGLALAYWLDSKRRPTQ